LVQCIQWIIIILATVDTHHLATVDTLPDSALNKFWTFHWTQLEKDIWTLNLDIVFYILIVIIKLIGTPKHKACFTHSLWKGSETEV
jgi:hypothetical protein